MTSAACFIQIYYSSNKSACINLAINAVLEVTSSLLKTRLKCVATVHGLICSCWAILLLVKPWAASWAISNSRGLRHSVQLRDWSIGNISYNPMPEISTMKGLGLLIWIIFVTQQLIRWVNWYFLDVSITPRGTFLFPCSRWQIWPYLCKCIANFGMPFSALRFCNQHLL